MKAYNRRNISESETQFRKSLGRVCVFLSHQKKDAEYTKKIADYILKNGIDVYFDEYDNDLKETNQFSHPGRVTQAILKGINASSHMLVVVSPNTMYSNWVPFEIGFGFDKTQLGILTIKGIAKGKLPSYLQTAKRIRDIYDINKFVKELSGRIEEDLIKSYSSEDHPLANVLDKFI